MKLTLILLVVSATTTALASEKIIYGKDNREDVINIKDNMIQEISMSIAGRVSNMQIDERDPKLITFEQVETLNWSGRVCADQKFASQPTVADCTGFFVGEDLLVTAGHCATRGSEPVINEVNNICATTSWLFDYKTQKDGTVKLTNADKSNLYKCKKIVYAINNGTEDYAVIQLDRKVTNRKPLKLRTKGKIQNDADIFVMGHPSGLPQKYADGAKVFSHEGPFFSTNLDTFGGNSGSPVFNMRTYEVEGILVRGDVDYIWSTHMGQDCRKVNVCDNNRENCIQNNSRIDGEHVSVIQRVLKYL